MSKSSAGDCRPRSWRHHWKSLVALVSSILFQDYSSTRCCIGCTLLEHEVPVGVLATASDPEKIRSPKSVSYRAPLWLKVLRAISAAHLPCARPSRHKTSIEDARELHLNRRVLTDPAFHVAASAYAEDAESPRLLPSSRLRGLPSSLPRNAHRASVALRSFRFRPRLGRRDGVTLPDQGLVGESSSDNRAEHVEEALGVCRLPSVIAKRLLVEVTEEMKRFDAHIGPLDAALEERPEVFEPIGVNLPAHVGFCVVNDFVRVVRGEPFIRLERVGVD